MLLSFFQHSFILLDNSLPLSCDHKEDNIGYMGLWALWANTFDVVYGSEANKKKGFLQKASVKPFLEKHKAVLHKLLYLSTSQDVRMHFANTI